MQIPPATLSGDAPRNGSRHIVASSGSSVQIETEHDAQPIGLSVVLIVEDELLIAMSIKDALEDVGYAVLGPSVTYGSAMSLARERRPDIALVNIDLRSERDGSVLARHLMEQFATPSIFISGAALRVAANQDFAWGSVAKPYHVETIVNAVRVVASLLAGLQPAHIPDGLTLFQSAAIRPPGAAGHVGLGTTEPQGDEGALV